MTKAPGGTNATEAGAFPGPRQAKVIAICNQKGGVGKTTTTINLAGTLAHYGARVLIADCDPQGNATGAYKVRMLDDEKEETQATTLVKMGDPRPLVAKTQVPNVDVLPASIDMVFLPARLREATAGERRYLALFEHLRGEYDYILMDMRPALDTDTDAQTAAADAALIQVDVDEWSMRAVKMQVAQHRKIMQAFGRPADDLDILGLVIGRVMRSMGDFDKKVYGLLKSHPRIPYVGEVPVRAADLKEARNAGLPVQYFRPRSDTAGFFREIAINAGLVKVDGR